jgi:hypothetical protein
VKRDLAGEQCAKRGENAVLWARIQSVRSLQVLKAQGMNEAELGVDAENEREAFELHQRLGYKTFGVDSWFRISMEA